MAAETLSGLRTRAQRRCDKENDDHISTAEWTALINDAYRELWDVVIESFGDWFVSLSPTYTVSGGSGSSSFSVPADFYLLRKVEKQEGTYWRRVGRFNLSESGSLDTICYRLMGSTLYLEPFPSVAGTYRMWYVPDVTTLSGDSDALDTRVDRYSEYIVIRAAIAGLQKEESDTTVLQQQLSSFAARIKTIARARDAGEPDRVGDIWADTPARLPLPLPMP